MDLKKITSSEEVKAYEHSFDAHKKALVYLQAVPGIGVIGSAGVLLLDLKAWVINKIFVNTTEQAAFATATYDDKSQDLSARGLRIVSVLNILSGGILVPIIFLFLLIIGYCCGSEEEKSGA